MTLDNLIKRLEAIRQIHGGRIKACINSDDLDTGHGTWIICNVQDVKFEYVRQVDGDGCQEVLADGSEKMSKCVVIS